jgi:phospholipid transport system substrate-binding protein
MIVLISPRLLKKFEMLSSTGSGVTVWYPFAIGSSIESSITSLKLNIALFIGSNGSSSEEYTLLVIVNNMKISINKDTIDNEYSIFIDLIINIPKLYTKMSMMIKKISILFIFILITSPVHSGDGPDVFLKKSVDEISNLVSENKDRFERDEDFLRHKMNTIVMPKLDIPLMSRIILGKKIWMSMSEQQKLDFVSAFKYRMTSTYMKSITAFDGEKIVFLPFEPGKRPNLALVKSKYIIPAGNIDVDYRLIKNSEGWRVYDIIFEGISLMKNYRADFRQHVSESGIDSLIKSLNK